MIDCRIQLYARDKETLVKALEQLRQKVERISIHEMQEYRDTGPDAVVLMRVRK